MWNEKNKKRLSPEQEKREDDQQKEESRRGAIQKEKIYPMLLEDNDFLERTKIFLQVFEMAISQAHMRTRQTMTVAELKLEDELKNNPEAAKYHKMFEIINAEKIDVAVDLVKSMYQIIENNLQDENKLRRLSELKLKFFEK